MTLEEKEQLFEETREAVIGQTASPATDVEFSDNQLTKHGEVCSGSN
jgi:hypothetical protein